MESAKENSMEQNTSMEELKMDEDENIKEISVEEDILGAQSLLMSDSDDDGNVDTLYKSNKSPLKKISPKISRRIVDSDDENEDNKHEQHKEQENDEKGSDNIDDEKEEEHIGNKKTKKKILTLIDSDSENDNETEQQKETENNSKSKFKGLIDSESDNDQDLGTSKKYFNSDSDNEHKSKKLQKKSKKHRKSIVDSDSDNSVAGKKSQKSTNKLKKPIKKDTSDSESNNDKGTKKKISSLVDSESEGDSASGNDSENDLDSAARAANFEDNNKDDSKGKTKKPKVMRASAKKALDEMQAIQSEQQRLHREAHISIPYHKPKKHTLQEFLKRRTIIQPQLKPNKGNSDIAAAQVRRIKMTTEEMEEYAKLMEERAKEAKEFFKSESEDEEDKNFKMNEGILDKQPEQTNIDSEGEEEVFKDNVGVLDNPTEEKLANDETISQENSEFRNEIELENNTITPSTHIAAEDNLDGVQLTEAELAELFAESEPLQQQENEQVELQKDDMSERPTCSKVLITEIIELPKLDMNTVKISPIKKHTPRTSLNIRQLLNVKNLSDSPSLSGDPNKLIDLETGDLIEKKPTGIENLMQRLMSSVKARKSKTNETCNILSTENGKIEITKVNVSLTESNDNNKEPKPGAAYFELKKNLKEIIKKKRLEEMHKKQEDELEYSKCLADDDEEEDEDDGEEDEEMETEEYEPDAKPKNKVIEIDDEENAQEVVELDEESEDDEEAENKDDAEKVEADKMEDKQENNDEDNDENEVDDDEEDDDEDEENSDDEEDNDEGVKETIDDNKRKHRIIKAFDDSDDDADKDDIDFLKTPPPPTQPFVFDTQATEKVTLEDEENELMGLCSGTFETQKSVANALMSQIPLTQNNGKAVDDQELMELCSGTFETQPSLETQMKTQQMKTQLAFGKDDEQLKPTCNKILSTDEEEELEQHKEDKQRVKKLTKKLKKKKAKLGFSDDEDDDDEEEQEDDNDQSDHNDEDGDLEPVNEEPETFVDYDSEENEILVQMDKKDKIKQAANFFEKEAELSESEWGSADEDEKNMDNYDVELGDEDEFDRAKLQAELGQIHARKMLDEDLREVRKIQEMLFEDEETDGVGRQRTFKWKNAEAGFSLDDGPRNENADGEDGDSGDDLNEHQWRKIRYERERFMKEQGLKPDSQDMSTTLPNTTIPSANSTIASVTTKKIQIITAKKTSVSLGDSKKSSPFLISKGISAMPKKSVRGSFLVRDKETLNKLAGLTKGQSSINASDMDNTAGTVSIKSIKPKNFVFATLTEEEHENLKRKADDLLNSSNENGTNFMKKPKMEPRRDKCFIDQLL